MKPAMPKAVPTAGVSDGDDPVMLRLYIAAGTQASIRASVNLAALCDHQAPGRIDIDVVDILHEPLRAMSEGILVTPTLVRLSPLPVIKIVGDLGDRMAVLHALGLAT